MNITQRPALSGIYYTPESYNFLDFSIAFNVLRKILQI